MSKLVLLVVALLLFSTPGFAGEIRVGGDEAACRGFFYPVVEGFEADHGVKVKKFRRKSCLSPFKVLDNLDKKIVFC